LHRNKKIRWTYSASVVQEKDKPLGKILAKFIGN